ncbi:MAG: hypothetical protein ACRD4U_01970 [Candidatus Acidiferrales bacterium]
MRSRFTGVALIAVLVLLPVSSALACWQMLGAADDCPMEQEGAQPAPQPTKTSCCYLSAAEPVSGATPFKLHKAAAVVALPVATAPAPLMPQPAQVALHGPPPGHGSSLQQLNCVFLI